MRSQAPDLARSQPFVERLAKRVRGTLMLSPPGYLEKRYLINFRQVSVIVLQSRRVNGQVFEPVARGAPARAPT